MHGSRHLRFSCFSLVALCGGWSIRLSRSFAIIPNAPRRNAQHAEHYFRTFIYIYMYIHLQYDELNLSLLHPLLQPTTYIPPHLTIHTLKSLNSVQLNIASALPSLGWPPLQFGMQSCLCPCLALRKSGRTCFSFKRGQSANVKSKIPLGQLPQHPRIGRVCVVPVAHLPSHLYSEMCAIHLVPQELSTAGLCHGIPPPNELSRQCCPMIEGLSMYNPQAGHQSISSAKSMLQ